MLDSDVLIPKNIIEELLLCEKDIVSGLYFNYFMDNGETKILPVAWMAITEREFEILKKKHTFPEFIKSHEDIRRNLTKQEIDSNQLIQVLIPSMGCVLLSRKVFSMVRYKIIDTTKFDNLPTTDDISFVLEAKKAGFESYCYTKVKCTHMLENKFEKDSQGNYMHPGFSY